MPSGGRHEIGLFAFAVAARRRGLDTDYLGADLPVEDWLSAIAEPGVAAVVVTMPTTADVAPTSVLVDAIRGRYPDLPIAAGGGEQDQAPDGVIRLGHDVPDAAKRLSEILTAPRTPQADRGGPR
jgi:methylmalonyl-CoA mutase cobalamin-binding subunit